MYSVEPYAKVRRSVMVDRCSEREVARLFGIHRQTVKKICQFTVPPVYQRKSAPPFSLIVRHHGSYFHQPV